MHFTHELRNRYSPLTTDLECAWYLLKGREAIGGAVGDAKLTGSP
jgi:hypothetical protein